MKAKDTTRKVTKCYDADVGQTRGTRIASEIVFLILASAIVLTVLAVIVLVILKLS